MSQNHRYREQIDACRPGSDDLALPALADLATAIESDRALAEELTRSQRFDRAVASALHDVLLPAGLLERLESRLAAGDLVDSAVADSAGPQVAEPVSLPANSASPSAPADGKPRFNRRGLFAAAASLAAIVLIALGAAFWPRPARHITSEQLVEMASGWNGLVSPKWLPLAPSKPPAAYPLPAEILGAQQWQDFHTPEGHSGVVFDLNGPGRASARLFVIASRDQYALPGTPFGRLPGTSGGIAIGAMHTGGLLYVLVVDESGNQKLEHLVRKQTIAQASPLRGRPGAAVRPA